MVLALTKDQPRAIDTTVIPWAQAITNIIPKKGAQLHYQLQAQSFSVTIAS